jgi:acetyl esterase/lipase
MLTAYKYSASLAAALLFTFSVAAAPQGGNNIDPAKIPVVYRVPGMERAVVRRGVVFDNSPAGPLAFDAYIPRGLRRGERRPDIVFISGAERVREWQWFVTWGQLAAAHGLIGIVPDKRYPRSFEGIRSGFEDTEKLLAFLRSNGGQLGVDPQGICLWTFSAGGRMTSAGLQPTTRGVKCLVSFYGVLDVSGEVPAATSGAERESLVKRYSPLHAMEALVASGGKSPPIFIARAGRDNIPVINVGIDRFAAAALRLNVPLTVANYPEGAHGFDGVNDTPESRAVIKAAIAFAREHTAAR